MRNIRNKYCGNGSKNCVAFRNVMRNRIAIGNPTIFLQVEGGGEDMTAKRSFTSLTFSLIAIDTFGTVNCPVHISGNDRPVKHYIFQ